MQGGEDRGQRLRHTAQSIRARSSGLGFSPEDRCADVQRVRARVLVAARHVAHEPQQERLHCL
jgi:hypothetical protein